MGCQVDGSLKERAVALQLGLPVVCCKWSTELEEGRSRAEEGAWRLDCKLQVRAGEGDAGKPVLWAERRLLWSELCETRNLNFVRSPLSSLLADD